MYDETDLLPISGLQHLAFCERQYALIHIEQIWDENMLTAQGKVLHEKAHEGSSETRGDVRTARGMRLRSLRLGLSGIADIVEFQRVKDTVPEPTKLLRLESHRGWWCPFPVEYKLGKPKLDNWDLVQLCAQAVCLEEMLGIQITAGALFYGRTRHRLDVNFSSELRRETEQLAVRMHSLFDSGQTPPARYCKACRSCSLFDICKPKKTNHQTSAQRYLHQSLKNSLESFI